MNGLLSAEGLLLRGLHQLRRPGILHVKERQLRVRVWAFTSRSIYQNRADTLPGSGSTTVSKAQRWSTKPPTHLQKAAAVAVEAAEDVETEAPALQSKAAKTGAFQSLPIVPPAEEHIRSALKRASRVSANKSIKNEAQQARNLCARQLDAITKEIAVPLGRILKGFPSCGQLHPFERALLDLTIGIASYEKRLGRVDALRKSSLEVGKAYAARASKATNKREAKVIMEEGFQGLEAFYRKNATAVDGLKDMAKVLRRLPTVDPATPTVALVGAPNVGKSSLVQVLSSGLPEVCNYPFTTRTVKMGHFFVDGIRHQVTDTPGLLNRKEEDRNAMERLTVACLQYLPTTVLFVIDLTGECGTTVPDQWVIRATLRANFADKPWLDVFSKADLLDHVFREADELGQGELSEVESGSAGCVRTPVDFVRALGGALRVSSTTEAGIPGLKACVLAMLSQQRLGL